MEKSWYRITAKGDTAADVYIYDEIGFFGVTAKDFVKDLNAIKADVINLRINTPGGSVFDGISIYNALRTHKAKIITHIDGLAASIGSIIALAGEEINIAENAFYMIHNPSALVIGQAKDMRQMADLLDKLAGSLVGTYTAKTGKPEAEIKHLMDEETWFTAKEAKEAGFVDNVTGNRAEKARFDLSVYNKVPAELFDSQSTPTERDLERTLREAGGLSRAAAKAVLAKGYKAILQREAEEAAQRDAVDEGIENKSKEDVMDISTLKDKHPGVYDAIRKEGIEAGKAEAEKITASAKEDAARAERERIQGVFATYRPGREEIVKACMFDGKSTKADVAEKILSAEDAKKDAYKNNLKEDARDVIVPAAEPGDGGEKIKGDFEALVAVHQADKKCSRAAAISAVAKSHPEAHQKWLAKLNKKEG